MPLGAKGSWMPLVSRKWFLSRKILEGHLAGSRSKQRQDHFHGEVWLVANHELRTPVVIYHCLDVATGSHLCGNQALFGLSQLVYCSLQFLRFLFVFFGLVFDLAFSNFCCMWFVWVSLGKPSWSHISGWIWSSCLSLWNAGTKGMLSLLV